MNMKKEEWCFSIVIVKFNGHFQLKNDGKKCLLTTFDFLSLQLPSIDRKQHNPL